MRRVNESVRQVLADALPELCRDKPGFVAINYDLYVRPDDIKVMPGLAVITGPSDAEAQERFEELQSLLHPAVALSMLAAKMGYPDLDAYPLDRPLPPEANVKGPALFVASAERN